MRCDRRSATQRYPFALYVGILISLTLAPSVYPSILHWHPSILIGFHCIYTHHSQSNHFPLAQSSSELQHGPLESGQRRQSSKMTGGFGARRVATEFGFQASASLTYIDALPHRTPASAALSWTITPSYAIDRLFSATNHLLLPSLPNHPHSSLEDP